MSRDARDQYALNDLLECIANINESAPVMEQMIIHGDQELRMQAGDEFRSILDVLQWRATHHPERIAFTFLGDGEGEQGTLTFAQLNCAARSRAQCLRDLGAQGQRAILLYPPGLEFICALLGCLYAGVLAIPAYPPRPHRLESRVSAIVDDARPTLALTTETLRVSVERQFGDACGTKKIALIATDNLTKEPGGDIPIEIDRASPAFLQYTSGSTSNPKGVIVTHGNLMHNERIIQAACQHDERSTFIGWLPMYHDMGLIGNLFQPLFIGASAVLMSPVAFLQKPSRWLRAISRYRGVTSGGPNFAYELCIRKISEEEKATLDLSSWRIAFNGAEPVRADTITRFTNAFSSFGFRREAFFPCYGLAEATLIVSGGSADEPPVIRKFASELLAEGQASETGASEEGAISIVGCGRALPGVEIRIVNAKTGEASSSGEIGEIWVAGPSVAAGYWNRPNETAEVLGACLEGRRFLRTGDLGFVHAGELFVTGRLKDLIIIHGRNYYPQDLERVADGAHPALRIGCGAALAVEGEAEPKLVMICEIDRRYENETAGVAEAIRQAVFAEFSLAIHTVVLIKGGTIPKTSSGKIRRSACRAAFLAKSLQVLRASALPNDFPVVIEETKFIGRDPVFDADRKIRIESYLRTTVSKVLGIDPRQCGAEQSLVALGLCSITSAQLQYQIEKDLNIDVLAVAILESDNIRALASSLAESADNSQVLQSEVEFPLIQSEGEPIVSLEQKRLWLLQRMSPHSSAFCISASFKLTGSLDLDLFQQSLNEVVRRHRILRTGYIGKGGVPQSVVVREARLPLTYVDLRGASAVVRSATVREFEENQSTAAFDVACPPLARSALARLTDLEWVFVVVLHHLIADGRSIEILARDLMAIYRSLRDDRPVTDLKDPLQYSEYSAWQAEWLKSREAAIAIDHWRNQLQHLPDLNFPFELRQDRLTDSVARQRGRVAVHISETVLDSLRELGRREKVTNFMSLAAVFQLVLHRLSGQIDVVTAFPIHGRFLSQFKDVIGFFAYPVLLRSDVSGNPPFRQFLGHVRERALSALHYERVPFSKVIEVASKKHPQAPLFRTMFNYLQPEFVTLEAGGVALKPTGFVTGPQDCDLVLNFCEMENSLSGELTYNSTCFDDETARWIAKCYLDVLECCIASPDSNLSQFQLPSRSVPYASKNSSRDIVLRVIATFTAEPLLQALSFWMEQMGVGAAIQCAPYHQVFQQLLLPREILAGSRALDVILVRLEDWQGRDGTLWDPAGRAVALGEIQRNLAAFLDTIRMTATNGCQHIVVFCPASGELGEDAVLQEEENQAIQILSSLKAVRVIGSKEILARYPVERYCDDKANREAQIPYTQEFFAALATAIARKIYAANARPRKVIVVDCDGTLWDGVCGEDGPEGVLLNASCLALQEFLVAQCATGMLICLCSKNEEKDVLCTLARTDMPLRPEHIVASRVNWLPKAENLASLSRELGLGLDTFIFVDDDEVQCMEVRTKLPEVMVLHFLRDPLQNLAMLHHVWDFDHDTVTATGSRRTALYREEFERQRALRAAPSLPEFLDSLGIEIHITHAELTSAERISELTWRTTQFNASGVRRSPDEVRSGLAAGHFDCLTVAVRDRFGDYGEVGVVIFQVKEKAVEVDTFLLSCRVLGRGIEHRMLAHLAGVARERGLEQIRIQYVPSTRNAPIFDFLQEAARRLAAPVEKALYRFPVLPAISFCYEPPKGPAILGETQDAMEPGTLRDQTVLNYDASKLAEITRQFSKPNALVQHLQSKQGIHPRDPSADGYIAPRTSVEAKLASMWSEMLGVDRVGVHDDFFVLGGHSLLAMQVLSRVWSDFGVDVSLTEFFQGVFTVAQLAKIIDNCVVRQASTEDIARQLDEIENISDIEAKARLSVED